MRRLVTAVVAFALLTSTAYGQGKNKGDEKRGGDRPPAAAQGGGQAQGQGRGNDADRGRDNAQAAATTRGSERRSDAQDNAKREQRGNSAQAERGAGDRADRPVQRASDERGRGNDDRAVVVDRRGISVSNRMDRGPDFSFVRQGTRGLIAGCPPGLARKSPPCVPPGQVRGLMRLFAFDRPDWWGLGWLDGGRYFYDDGYLVRLGPGGRIASYVPLLGGALSIGSPWPGYYAPVPVPDYYVDYYDLGPYDSYRYADNAIYRVDPETDLITSIAALLTGDQFAIGEPLPLGYDVYNVPYGYRDQYYDTPDALYRYSDGYIYEVDPETRLIAAAIELLAS